MRSLITLLLAATLATSASADAQTIAITGGTVYPVSGPRIENGTVLIRDGRIAAVGANVAVPGDAQRIDATGKWVTPGLFNASTQLGLYEIGAVEDTRDAMARGVRGIAAAFSAWDGLNPRSQLIPPARNEGVTTVAAVPAGGLIAGQAAVIDLIDGPAASMVLRAPAAMVGQIGESQSGGAGARGELILHLRELLEDTRSYRQNRQAYEQNRARQFSASRADLEAMVPVIEGRLPLMLAADRASDIEAALEVVKDFGLRLMILGGAEAWEVASELAAARVPVLAGAENNIPTSFAALGQRQENVALLRRAGVTVALIGNNGDGDEEAFNVRDLKQEAGNSVAYGLPWDEALRAVTLAPAQLFGVADRVGSLEPGKEANVVVWSGDPFELSTSVEHVIVRGRRMTSVSRQELLERRYRTLPPDYFRP